MPGGQIKDFGNSLMSMLQDDEWHLHIVFRVSTYLLPRTIKGVGLTRVPATKVRFSLEYSVSRHGAGSNHFIRVVNLVDTQW